MIDQSAKDVTDLLRAWGAGDAQASDAVGPLVYDELRRQAGLALRRESNGHTLQTTALVHEAWLRLDAQRDMQWDSRSQFYAVAAQMMRRILVDHARRRHAAKRGAASTQITLGAVDREHERQGVSAAPRSALDPIDLLALDDALARLGALDPRKVQLVELRYFAGLSMPEAAEALGISLATAGREWSVARMWLRRELEE
ncbi:MAG TPA: ECF-type sigma factor [Gemmatimonadaceae bacterium]|nr:ECF-type sigma factor [Gemmatimonadaceae bacterium]